ncbi:MAG: hypothetical protein HY040_02795 [Planctomycetes bacterium]|nr:hypothetical protein [Planctomycetota bacterium]
MIRFPCPKCKTQFSVDNSFAGGTADCTWCGEKMTIPQAYAAGAVTDDERDPNLAALQPESSSHAVQDGGPNPYQLPEYQGDHRPPQASSGSGINGWVVFILIIVVLNLVLIPLTGWAIIPR